MNNQNVLIVAGAALAGLVGFALWMMFSWQAPVLPSKLQEETQTILQEAGNATPAPQADQPQQPTGPTPTSADDKNTDFKKIEAEFNTTVINDNDFNELDGE